MCFLWNDSWKPEEKIWLYVCWSGNLTLSISRSVCWSALKIKGWWCCSQWKRPGEYLNFLKESNLLFFQMKIRGIFLFHKLKNIKMMQVVIARLSVDTFKDFIKAPQSIDFVCSSHHVDVPRFFLGCPPFEWLLDPLYVTQKILGQSVTWNIAEIYRRKTVINPLCSCLLQPYWGWWPGEWSHNTLLFSMSKEMRMTQLVRKKVFFLNVSNLTKKELINKKFKCTQACSLEFQVINCISMYIWLTVQSCLTHHVTDASLFPVISSANKECAHFCLVFFLFFSLTLLFFLSGFCAI